ncbi:MAG: PfkB family carbohydrate kinase [Pyrinomonadaceae bacterium]
MQNLIETLERSFPGKRIVIVGDLVADQFLHGTIARVSREAPVFILKHEETDTCAGGAANAAVNVASLGGEPILIGVTGQDAEGELLAGKLKNSGVNCDFVIADKDLRTTTKVRVLAGQHYAPKQQVIRIDYENQAEISPEVTERLVSNLRSATDTADAIIISDYNYGAAGREIFELARSISKQKRIPLLIDSRFRLADFPGATSATPNQEEVEQILGKDFTPESCEELRSQLGFESLLVTCGNKGMMLVETGKPPIHIEAVGSTEPVDVTGAGDTVIAVYALGLASRLSFNQAAVVANHAGGIVVMKKGTASVCTAELVESIKNHAKAGALESAS